MEVKDTPGVGCVVCGVKCPAGGMFDYGGRRICSGCLERVSLGENLCPACGTKIDPQSEHQLAFTLEKAGVHSEANKHIAALVIVCPSCRNVFMDEFQYKLLKKGR